MSILNTSVSGMQGNSNWLSTISQNVANANTNGYKNVETEFSSLVDQVSANEANFAGVSTSQVSLNGLQGNVVSTSTTTNLAVQGAGFFVVSDSSGTMYLTRNGSFTPDASGNLVNSAGYYLMAANVQNGVSPLAANSLTDLQKVNVVNAGQTATPTTTALLTANLPSTATPVAPANLPSANSASSTYTEATSLVVYDNLGASHTINVYYTNTGSNTWQVDAFDASKASPSGGFPIRQARLRRRPSHSIRRTARVLRFPAFAYGAEWAADELDLTGTTQLAAGFNVTAATANGMAPSGISGVSISTSGSLTFNYANGTSTSPTTFRSPMS